MTSRDLFLPFALMWVVSLVRVITVVQSGRHFGGVDTLAAMSLLLLPWLLGRRVKGR